MSTTSSIDKHDNLEKADVGYLERAATHDSDGLNDARIAAFTPEQQKKIIRRVDIRLVLTLGALYCVSLMDRTNTGIAVVAGMGVDLALIGSRYSIIVLVFFLTYVFLQPPATVVLRKVGPRIFLPSITMLWGITMIGMGFLKVWTQLIPLRLLLGVFEAGFFPGCAYLLSCWYPRYELQKRNAVFYLIGSLSSAFSGILAYAFSLLAGHGSGAGLGQKYLPTRLNGNRGGQRGGIAGWRWIFILQGVLTCVIALISFFTIVDFPEIASKKSLVGLRFLNEDEANFMVARVEKDRHDAHAPPFKLSEYLKHALDLKIWGFAFLFMLSTTVSYAIAYFLPIILQRGMGFNVRDSQCLIAPPYVFAAFVMFAMAWAGDKYHIRSPFIIINGLLCVVGLSLLGYSHNVGVRYFGVFLATAGANSNIPCVLTWQANNIRGQWKRALCSATLVGFGGIGGIIGSTVFRQKDSPVYGPGIITTILAGCLIVVITMIMAFSFSRSNKRVANGGRLIENMEGFRYTL